MQPRSLGVNCLRLARELSPCAFCGLMSALSSIQLQLQRRHARPSTARRCRRPAAATAGAARARAGTVPSRRFWQPQKAAATRPTPSCSPRPLRRTRSYTAALSATRNASLPSGLAFCNSCRRTLSVHNAPDSPAAPHLSSASEAAPHRESFKKGPLKLRAS